MDLIGTWICAGLSLGILAIVFGPRNGLFYSLSTLLVCIDCAVAGGFIGLILAWNAPFALAGVTGATLASLVSALALRQLAIVVELCNVEGLHKGHGADMTEVSHSLAMPAPSRNECRRPFNILV